MAEYKKEAGAMAAIAVIGVLALAAAGVYFFPSNPVTSNSPPHGATTAASSSTQTFLVSTTTPMMLTTTSMSIGLQSTVSTIGPSSTTTYLPPALGNTTTNEASQPQWEAAPAVNLTLYSPFVQTFIRNAYSYGVECCTSSFSPSSNVTSIYLTIYVVGSQAVSGNWTSGYLVARSGVETLAVNVQFTEPAFYRLASLNATLLPGLNYSITYSPLQQEVITAALSNSTVNGNLVSDGLSPYYVGNVTAFGGGNGTYAGDYFLTFLQTDGPRFIGVFVNSTTMQVVKVFEDSAAYSMCYYPGDICFSSPWDSLSEPDVNQTSTTSTTITTT